MTLTEIMVVVAIVGILGSVMMNFDFEGATDKERLDRFVARTAASIRHAKTAAVSGRTAVTGGCPAFAIEIGEKAMTGTSVSFSQTGSVGSTCGPDSDSSIPSPIFGESANYSIPAITGYDKNGAVTYRIANASDYPAAPGNLPAAKSVVVFVEGSNLRAYPMNCGNVSSCVDYAKNQAVKLKINLAYKQPMNTRIKSQSKDVWLDLRTGNLQVLPPVSP